jgi:hypothetical protein
MLTKIMTAWSLVAITVIIHGTGLGILLRPMFHSAARVKPMFWPVTWLVIRIAWWLIVIHVAEIALWAFFYWWQGCFPDAEISFYFSGVTYTTLGYGDVVLPMEWRMFGPVQGLTGILMAGLSTGFFFAVVGKLYMSHLPGADR